MSIRPGSRGRAAASDIRLALRSLSMVATRSARFSRCVLRCQGSRSPSTALMLRAACSIPPIQTPNPSKNGPSSSRYPTVNHFRPKPIGGEGLWLYPDVKEEFEEKQYLARIAKERPPMITGDCTRMRGIESRDFIREDKNPDRCWVDLLTFRRLYPELAPHTDEQASARIRVENGLPLENWDESPWEELLKAAALTFGPPAGTLAALLLWKKRRKRV